jgi:hypothetical protein
MPPPGPATGPGGGCLPQRERLIPAGDVQDHTAAGDVVLDADIEVASVGVKDAAGSLGGQVVQGADADAAVALQIGVHPVGEAVPQVVVVGPCRAVTVSASSWMIQLPRWGCQAMLSGMARAGLPGTSNRTSGTPVLLPAWVKVPSLMQMASPQAGLRARCRCCWHRTAPGPWPRRPGRCRRPRAGGSRSGATRPRRHAGQGRPPPGSEPRPPRPYSVPCP